MHITNKVGKPAKSFFTHLILKKNWKYSANQIGTRTHTYIRWRADSLIWHSRPIKRRWSNRYRRILLKYFLKMKVYIRYRGCRSNDRSVDLTSFDGCVSSTHTQSHHLIFKNKKAVHFYFPPTTVRSSSLIWRCAREFYRPDSYFSRSRSCWNIIFIWWRWQSATNAVTLSLTHTHIHLLYICVRCNSVLHAVALDFPHDDSLPPIRFS
jgi:hypothetical protein